MMKAFEVKIPMTPNFIRRKDDDFPIPVQEFTDAELLEIGNAWIRDLMIKAQNKRNRLGGE